jgi:hypothetical protein
VAIVTSRDPRERVLRSSRSLLATFQVAIYIIAGHASRTACVILVHLTSRSACIHSTIEYSTVQEGNGRHARMTISVKMRIWLSHERTVTVETFLTRGAAAGLSIIPERGYYMVFWMRVHGTSVSVIERAPRRCTPLLVSLRMSPVPFHKSVKGRLLRVTLITSPHSLVFPLPSLLYVTLVGYTTSTTRVNSFIQTHRLNPVSCSHYLTVAGALGESVRSYPPRALPQILIIARFSGLCPAKLCQTVTRELASSQPSGI